jgi:hypothetical protein
MEQLEIELQHYYEKLGKSVLATNDFKTGTKRVFKEQAKYYQWITFRPQQQLTYLGFDFDDDNPYFLDKIKELNLKPNLTIQNPNNKKGQIYFRLNNPVSIGEKSKSEPERYFNTVRKSLNNALESDPHFSNRFGKNPFFKEGFFDKKNNVKHKECFVINSYSDQGCDLGDFKEYVDTFNKAEYVNKQTTIKHKHKHRAFNGVLTEGNRNKSIFNHSRLFAYGVCGIYKRQNDELGLLQAVLNECAYINNKSAKRLTDKELLGIANSITGYCFRNYDEQAQKIKIAKCKNYVQRGAYALKTAHCTTTQEKQIVSASETNKKRVRTTEQKIKSAIYSIKADSQKVTQKAIAAVSGLGIATIKRYSKLIKSLK